MAPAGEGWGRLVSLMVAMLAGCASHFPPCPSSGGPAWRELDSDHFRLTTDLDRDAAVATLGALEELRAALVASIAARPDLPTGQLPVVALDRGWNEVAAEDVEGFFLPSVIFRPLVVMKAGSELSDEVVIKHELVHFYSRKVIPHQPRWLAEGLATYFQTIEYDSAAGRITVGKPPSDLLAVASRRALVDARRLFAATEIPEDDRNAFYPTAWLAVHYLMNHHHAAFIDYEVALARQPPDPDAWAHAFPDLPPDKLDDELARYVDGGQYELLMYPFKPSAPRVVAERTLDDADAHATRALLVAASSLHPGLHWGQVSRAEMRARAEHEAGETLRAAPDHLLAQAVQTFLLGDPARLETARAATRAHPNDWMAWLLVAGALKQGDADLQQALERAVVLAGRDPTVTLTNVAMTK
jgi:hypothetical protein